MQNSNSEQSEYRVKLILIPVLLSLFIFVFEDFLNNVFFKPFIYILKKFMNFTIPSSGNEYITANLLLNLFVGCGALILIYFAFVRRHIWSKQSDTKQYGIRTTLKVYIALFSLVTIIGIIFTAIVVKFFPKVSTTSSYQSFFPNDPSYSYFNVILLIILACILAPILEELVFRRMLIPLLEGSQQISTTFAVLISASVFAFAHSESDLLDGSIFFTIIHFCSTFILGFGLASIYVSTRKVRYNIFLHSLNNSIAVIGTLVLAYSDVRTSQSIVIYQNNHIYLLNLLAVVYSFIIFVLLLGGIGLVIYYLFRLKKVFYPLRNQFKGKISNTQIAKGLIIILATEGVIFIVIPVLESLFFDKFNVDTLMYVIINAGISILVFLVIMFYLLKNKKLILKQNSIINPPLIPFISEEYHNMNKLNYYSSVYTGAPPSSSTEVNSQQNIYNNEVINQNPNNEGTTICPNCKAVIPANNIKFCTYCGFELV